MPPLSENEMKSRANIKVMIISFFLGVLFVDVLVFSRTKSLESRLETQSRRMERVERVMLDLLDSRDNAAKIEEIEQQVNSIGASMDDLTDFVQASKDKVSR